MPITTMDIRAGANIGRYQLLAEIGRGAMGTVYQALDPEIDRIVAIKTFTSFDGTSQEATAFRDRFAREARAAGRLAHPGIVAIYDRGEEETTQTPYIVMEYVAGQPLAKLLDSTGGRLEEQLALRLTKQVAEALAYAHEKGIVHRDIKPANILVTEEGNAKIADFGIARIDMSNMTLRGEVLGTPAFMSPEQLSGGDVDGRSDLFSLGVILYTMLMGFRPFQGNGASTISFKVLNREPLPITAFHLDLSKDAEYVVARAMAKNASDRYQTGTAMANDLADILAGKPPRSRFDSKAPAASNVVAVYSPTAPNIPALSLADIASAAAPARAIAALTPPPGAMAAPTETVMPVATAVPVSSGTEAMSVSPDAARIVVSPYDFVFLCLVISLTVLGFSTLTLLYVNHLESRFLHAADRKLGMPPLIAERIALPALGANSNEPVVEVSLPLPTRKPAAEPRREAFSDLDRTVIRNPRPAAAVSAQANAKPVGTRIPPQPRTNPTGESAQPVTLDLALQHQFVEAQVEVWVDQKLAFSEVTHGSAHKRLFVFRGAVEARESHQIHLPSGDHVVKVHISSKGDGFDQSGTVRSNFVQSHHNLLNIHCNKSGMELKLTTGS